MPAIVPPLPVVGQIPFGPVFPNTDTRKVFNGFPYFWDSRAWEPVRPGDPAPAGFPPPLSYNWFLHTPGGGPSSGIGATPTRQFLTFFDGATWQGIFADGTTTLYVDGALGTDAIGNGWGPGTNAYKSIQYAWNSLPALIGGNVTINIAPGTYTENLILQGKTFAGNYTITFQGTRTLLATITATGGVQGSGSTQGTTTPGFISGSTNKMLRYTSGVNSGTYRIIDAGAPGGFTIVGTWPTGAPGVGDICVLEDWGTIASGGSTAALIIQGAQQGVVFDSIKFTNTAASVGYCCLVQAAANASFNRCWIDNNLLIQNPGSKAVVSQGFIDTPATGLSYNGAVQAQFNGAAVVTGSKLLISTADNGYGLYAAFSGSISCNQLTGDGNVLDGTTAATGNYGVWANSNSNITLYTPGGWNRVRNWFNGIRADDCSSVVYADAAAYVAYSGNTTDQNGIAATFGVVRNSV